MQIKIRDPSARKKPSQYYVLCMYMYPSTISTYDINNLVHYFVSVHVYAWGSCK